MNLSYIITLLTFLKYTDCQVTTKLLLPYVEGKQAKYKIDCKGEDCCTWFVFILHTKLIFS